MITRDERIGALLARGFLPKELPPPFTSLSFAQSIANIIPKWATHEAGLTAQQRRSYPPVTRYARFDMARKGHSRRLLGVPNPVNQYYLSAAIADHQDDFENTFASSPISLTSAVINLDGDRAVPMLKLSVLSEKRIQSYSIAGAILQTDVLSFYHAIYTHSIPWALHGKKAAKRNRSTTDPAVYGNQIDMLLRACQDGQTVGIPVGPDTSRIVSEIILCAVEKEIGKEHFSRLIGGYRYMDDFFLCFRSHVDAEGFLAALRDAVLGFDLQLNASKTRILNALDFNEESWPSDISQLKIGHGWENQRRDLIRFFTEAIRISKSLPDESIASFSIRKSSRVFIQEDNWDLYEPFLLRMARENTSCLDSVVKILCTYAAAGYNISNRVSEFANSMIEEHAPYNHHYEVVWILWLCRSLSIRLGERATQQVAKVENSLCACLVLMLRGRTLLTGRGSVSEWLGKVSVEDLHSEHWMLVYEAGRRKSWKLPGAEDAVATDPHFRILRDEGVSFFDSTASNVAVDLPNIDRSLNKQLGNRRSALLNGNIFTQSMEKGKRKYQKLGEDYGNDEEGHLDIDWDNFHIDLD